MDSEPSRFVAVRRGGRFKRQLQREARSEILTRALGHERAAEFFRRQRTIVQTEAVAGLSCGETVREDTREVLWRNTDAIVDDGDGQPISCLSQSQGDLFVGPLRVIAGMNGVADQVDENLEHFVSVDRDRGTSFELAHNRRAVTFHRGRIDPQRVFHQFDRGQCFHDTRHARIVLLHRDDVPDVFDVTPQMPEFFDRVLLLDRNGAR